MSTLSALHKLGVEGRTKLYNNCNLLELFNLGSSFPEFMQEILDCERSITWIEFYRNVDKTVNWVRDFGRGGEFSYMKGLESSKFWVYRFYWWKCIIEGVVDWLKPLANFGLEPSEWFWEDCPAFHWAKWDFDFLKAMLDVGFPVDVYCSFGTTPLMIAIKKNDIRVLELFLKHNQNPTILEVIEIDGKWSSSALTQAIRTNKVECAKLVIEAGANTKCCLHEAITFEHPDCLKMLVEKFPTINLNEEDSWGWTPLQWACALNSLECVQILIKAGANVLMRDKNFRTAYDIAKEKKCHNIVKYFESLARIKFIKKTTKLNTPKLYGIPRNIIVRIKTKNDSV
jgi:Ankyrin repeats (many copies)/Ankyrin repeats (3 copies)